MNFSQLFIYYRERKGFKTAEEFARQWGVSGSYVRHIETGRRKPPPLKRVEEIAKLLNVSGQERDGFLKSAASERLPKKEMSYLEQSDPRKMAVRDVSISYNLSPDILEALSDPVAVQALLATHKCKEDIKKSIRDMITCLPNLAPEKRQAILALCK